MIMPFGKFEGMDLRDVPRPYLEWLRRQTWLKGRLVKAIDDVLESEEREMDQSVVDLLKRMEEDQKR